MKQLTIAIKLSMVFILSGVTCFLISKNEKRNKSIEDGQEINVAIANVNDKYIGISFQITPLAVENIMIVDHKAIDPIVILVSHTLIV